MKKLVRFRSFRRLVFGSFPMPADDGFYDQFRDAIKTPPAWLDGGHWRFVLGTDEADVPVVRRVAERDVEPYAEPAQEISLLIA